MGLEGIVRPPSLPRCPCSPWALLCFGTADGARDLEPLGAMPPGLIEQDDCVPAGRNLGCDLIKMKHGLAVAGWQHEGSSGPAFRADRTEQIGRLGTLIVDGART